MWERIGFTAESTADKGAIDIDLMHRHLKYIGQGAMEVMRYLLRCVERQTTAWVPMGDSGMWFGEAVIDAGEFPLCRRGGE